MLVLTERQRECMLLRSRGLSNKEVAKALGCALNTVDYHFRTALKKNPEENEWTLFAEFVREQCKQGVWE